PAPALWRRHRGSPRRPSRRGPVLPRGREADRSRCGTTRRAPRAAQPRYRLATPDPPSCPRRRERRGAAVSLTLRIRRTAGPSEALSPDGLRGDAGARLVVEEEDVEERGIGAHVRQLRR